MLWRNRPLPIPVPLLLMALSILLLIILQGLWLAGTWKETRDEFRNRTTHLFSQTIFSLRDSLLERNIKPLEAEALAPRDSVLMIRSEKVIGRRKRMQDSLSKDTSNAYIDVFFSRTVGDSLPRVLRPLLFRLDDGRPHRRFIVRLDQDSLSMASISRAYRQALEGAGIVVPFDVYRLPEPSLTRLPPGPAVGNRTLATEWIPFNHVIQYAAIFPETDWYFLKAILPEILFSLFVLLVTTASFYSMRNSIRSQTRLLQLKNDFIGNITHELKTPVATVSVALEALTKFRGLNDEKKTCEYLGMAQSELNRLTLMTDKILQTAAFEKGEFAWNTGKVDLDKEFREVVNSLRLMAEKKRVVVTYTSAGEDATVTGSAEHLVMVLYNLLDNAIKYTRDDSVIAVEVEGSEFNVRLAVRDQGIGIPAHYQQRIFEKFFRVPTGDVHNTKGHGLGLSYVHGVVKAHGGSIAVQSEEGAGACFVITLPKNAKA